MNDIQVKTKESDMAPLKTFAAPLQRLILCGGGGLPPAWGPLLPAGSAEPTYTLWHGSQRGPVAVSPFHHMFVPMEAPEAWSIPLDASSPWPARLGLVAAYLAWQYTRPEVRISQPETDMLAGSIDSTYYEWEMGDVIALTRFAHCGALPNGRTWRWSVKTGMYWDYGMPRLPTLPTHLANHQPVVALPLALYDVPEIRARVDAL